MRLTQKVTVVAVFISLIFGSTSASAGNDFKNGFENQMGRLLAYGAYNIGRTAFGAPPIYPGPYAYPNPYYYPRPYYPRRYYPGRYYNPYISCNYRDPSVQAYCINSINRYGP
tara:strand:+ start:90 stop:428 length:339 start_codon:yes stop_codon:yes gene_type:complete